MTFFGSDGDLNGFSSSKPTRADGDRYAEEYFDAVGGDIMNDVADGRDTNGVRFEEDPAEALADRVMRRMPQHNRWEDARE